MLGGGDSTSRLISIAPGEVTRVYAEDELSGDFGRMGRFDDGDGEVLVAAFGFEGFPAIKGAFHPGMNVGGISGRGKFSVEVFAVGADHVDSLFGSGVVPIAFGHGFAVLFEEEVGRVVFHTVKVPLILGIEHIDLVGDGDELGAEFDDFRV